MAARSSSYRGRMWGQHATAVALRRPRIRTFARALSDGACTTVHVAAYPVRTTRVRLEVMGRPIPLASWCEQSGVENAIVGGFFLRQGDGTPLGEIWRRRRARSRASRSTSRGTRRGPASRSSPGTSAWRRATTCPSARRATCFRPGRCSWPAAVRSCTMGSTPRASRRTRRSSTPTSRRAATRERRWASAATGSSAVACDGRGPHDAGLTLRELADLMVTLGADRAINLDGGGSTSLVHEGELLQHSARGTRNRAGRRPAGGERAGIRRHVGAGHF